MIVRLVGVLLIGICLPVTVTQVFLASAQFWEVISGGNTPGFMFFLYCMPDIALPAIGACLAVSMTLGRPGALRSLFVIQEPRND